MPVIDRPSPPVPKRSRQDWKIIDAHRDLKRALIDALDRLIGCDRTGRCPRERCAGNTAIWKDDPDGASAGWGIIVRAYEETGGIIL